jgi:hypothetical protein
MRTQEFESPQEALAHHGVKGMKWGVHRTKSHISRKENRRLNKEASQKFYADKASKIYEEAKKGGEKVLIETKTPGDYAKTILTGREFAQHLERGGYMDVKTTEVFARQPKPNSQYVLNDKKIGTYKKQDFRKS